MFITGYQLTIMKSAQESAKYRANSNAARTNDRTVKPIDPNPAIVTCVLYLAIAI